MDQKIAQKYYQDERAKNKKERPWLYWIILAVLAIIVMVLFTVIGT